MMRKLWGRGLIVGLFHSEYRGKTRRENLGIPRPPNRYLTSAR
jgi:hypothetical protein